MKKILLTLAIVLSLATPTMADELIPAEQIDSVADVVHNFYIRYHDTTEIPTITVPAKENANIYHENADGTMTITKGCTIAHDVEGMMIVDNLTFATRKLLTSVSEHDKIFLESLLK